MWDILLCIGINFLWVDVNWIHKCPHILRVSVPNHPVTQISDVALGTKLAHHIFDSMLQLILNIKQDADVIRQDFTKQRITARVVYPNQLNMVLDWEPISFSNFVQNKDMLCALKLKSFFQLQNETYQYKMHLNTCIKRYLPSLNTAYMDQDFPAKSLDFQPTFCKRKTLLQKSSWMTTVNSVISVLKVNLISIVINDVTL